MEVQVNYLAVVLAMFSSMVIGAIWYSRAVFGSVWAKALKLSDKDLTNGAGQAMGTAAVVSLLTAFVLAHMSFIAHDFYGNSFLYDSLLTAFWLWLGLTAARIITHAAFERRAPKITAIAIGYELITLEIMALIIGLMKY